MDCQKCFTKLHKMKDIQSEIKPIKIGKKPRTTYCFGCKDFTLNFKSQEKKWQTKYSEMNKTVLYIVDPKMDRTKNKRLVMQAKCPVCRIKKSRFVKNTRSKRFIE